METKPEHVKDIPKDIPKDRELVNLSDHNIKKFLDINREKINSKDKSNVDWLSVAHDALSIIEHLVNKK